MTEDWVKVRGDQLAPRDGAYDLRITAELWETHFFDLVSLLVVDHPGRHRGLRRRAVRGAAADAAGRRRPGRSSRSRRCGTTTGGDVSDLAAARDSRYVDFAGRGPYQGITRAHFVEMELPDAAPRTGPLWLVAQGWIHPTDSSINVAIGQGAHAAPEGLSLHVADAGGPLPRGAHGPRLSLRARTRRSSWISTGLFGATGPRRLRLATNLEIFWDRLGWAIGRPDVAVHTAPARPAERGSLLSRLLGDRTAGRQRSGAPALHAGGNGAAVARSRGLLHALRRRARSAAGGGRSLRHHERRRRAAPALPRGAAARARARSRLHRRSETAG